MRVVRGGGTVAADPLRLEQAVGNLVDDALRYGAGEVVLSCRRENGGLASALVGWWIEVEPDLRRLVDRLIAAAQAAGARDDITVLVAAR